MTFEQKKLLRKWIGFGIIFIGFLFVVAPFALGGVTAYQQRKALEKVEDEIASGITGSGNAAQSSVGNTSGADGNPEVGSPEVSDTDTKTFIRPSYDEIISSLSPEQAELFEKCKNYNEELIENEQENLTDLASVERFSIDMTKYGYSENTIGTIFVPRLGVELPLYLGSSRNNMANGAAVFGETSIPMSVSKSANSSIAGHRGYRGAPMFRNIQLMQIGDPIYIKTPWEELVYRVCDLQIVTPDDNSWCMIMEDRNIITLMTCHPYTRNYQRYIVFAELSDEPFMTKADMLAEAERTFDSSPREVRDFSGDEEMIVLVGSETVDPNSYEYGAAWSNIMIIAEKQLKIIAVVVGVFEFIVLIYLLYETRKCHNKAKDKE